jgi:membrane protease YdiL (CAAX protease family)
MSTMPASWIDPGAPRRVAPAWHTILLLGFFAGLALLGAIRQHVALGAAGAPRAAAAASEASVLALYASLIAGEWALVFYVWRAGLRRAGVPLGAIVGGRWTSAKDVARDVALGVLLWGTWAGVSALWSRLAGPDHAASVGAFLPHGVLESALWIALSASAGVCEEIVFRGYLQRQFTAWTKSPWLALVLQAAVFGVSHGYQGAAACLHIAVFGLLFGAFALWRRSLRPGMIAHALTDVVAGLARF